jgi:hypothetical protein
MRCTDILKTSVSPEMKLQAKVIADRELLSEATWLKRLVIREIRAHNDASGPESDLLWSESIPGPARVAPEKNGAGKPMLVRLTAEDRPAPGRPGRGARHATSNLRNRLAETSIKSRRP